MTAKTPIILASGSAIRADILRGAGVAFEAINPDVDEDAIKRQAADEDADLEKTAERLADAKCLAVAKDNPGLVIGSDQILEFQGRAYDKPKDIEGAQARLMEMQGKAHTLINAIAVARGGALIWRHVARPKLTMRALTAAEIDAYLEAAGEDILSSVGAYQIEKAGARLFEKTEGDYFAVLGLSLFPLLGLLRREGAIEF